ncbi:MAG: hypothetical protein AAF598_19595, partial [Bacteroidota bacterium]
MPSVIFHVPDDFYFHERLTARLINQLCTEIVDEFYTPTYAELALTYNESDYKSGLKIDGLLPFLQEEDTEVNSITIKRLLNDPLSIVIYLEGKKSTHSARFTNSSRYDEINQKVNRLKKKNLEAIKRDMVDADAKEKKTAQHISDQNHEHSFGILGLARQLSKSHNIKRQRQHIYFLPGLIFYRNEIVWSQFADAIWDDITSTVNPNSLQLFAIREPSLSRRLRGIKSLANMLRTENLDNMTFRIEDGSQRSKRASFSFEMRFRKAIDMKKGTRYSMRISVASKEAKFSEKVGQTVMQGIFFLLEQHKHRQTSSLLQFDFFQIRKGLLPDSFRYDLEYKRYFEHELWLHRLTSISQQFLSDADEAYFLVDYLKYEYYFLPEMFPQMEELIHRRGCTKLIWKKGQKDGHFIQIDIDPHPNEDYKVQLLANLSGVEGGEEKLLAELLQKPSLKPLGAKGKSIHPKWFLDP